MGRRVLNPAYEMTYDQAARLLGLDPDAGISPEEVTRAYRRQVAIHHPDRGGDPEQMKRINFAREVLEGRSGAPHTPPPPRGGYRPPRGASDDEVRWARYRAARGPRPSGAYTRADLERVAREVFARGMTKVVTREPVAHVPMDVVFMSKLVQPRYSRPFGSAMSRRKMPKGQTAETLADSLAAFRSGAEQLEIFDVGITDREAWVTWRYDPSGPSFSYQSISFEVPKPRAKKKKGVGMKASEAADVMRELGLRPTAGGAKYGYWSEPGRGEKTGRFIRESKRTLRPVTRYRQGGKIADSPATDEVYYGKLTRAQLERWAQWVKQGPNPDAELRAAKGRLLDW